VVFWAAPQLSIFACLYLGFINTNHNVYIGSLNYNKALLLKVQDFLMEEEHIRKTGTTTVALVARDGVVLAADKRATAGYLIAAKDVTKILNVSDDIAVTTAGTVSDIQLMVKYLKSEIKIKELRTARKMQVKEAANLMSMLVYNNIRKFSTIPGISHFLMAGKDASGFSTWDINADGSISEVKDYVSSGSGSVMAYGVLETLYKEGLSVEEAVKLAAKAVNAAVQRDIASGNGIDIVTVTGDGVRKVLSKQIDTTITV